jgi:hypothetical protein
MTIKRIIKNYPFEWFSALVLLIYFFPIIFFPNQARFLIHDNLDGTVPLLKFTGNWDTYFAPWNKTIHGILNGVPRASLATWSFFSFLFLLFKPIIAYSIHYIFQHLISFIGMRLLIKNFISDKAEIYNGVALAFSLLPFWPGGELTVAGLPLLVWALINYAIIKPNILSALVIFFFPFFSHLPFGNFFSLPLIFFFFFMFMVWRKVNLMSLILPLILLMISSFVSEYYLIRVILSGIELNRLDYNSALNVLNLKGIFGVSILSFLLGHYHFHSLHLPIFLLLLIFIFIKVKSNYKSLFTRKNGIYMILIFSLVLFSVIITIFDNSTLLSYLPRISIRLWVFWPILWYVIFAWLTTYIDNRYVRKIVLLFQVIWVGFLIYPKDYFGSQDSENVFIRTFFKKNDNYSEFNKYYLVDQFDSIKKEVPDIVLNNTVSLGFSGTICLYNGLKTYDAYLNMYPLKKWVDWKDINKFEYKKDNIKHLHSNKPMLYSSELSHGITEIQKPNWNYELLKKNNVVYILTNNIKIKDLHFVTNINGLLLYKI